MFGSNDDKKQNPIQPTGGQDVQDTVPTSVPPTIGMSASPLPPPIEPPTADVAKFAPSAPTLTDPMVTPAPTETLPAEAGIGNVSMASAYIETPPQIGPAKTSEPGEMPTAASIITTTPPAPANSDLTQIKKQALQSLTPLVSHLEQTPEEKFKTLMMMIQASDNSSLLNEAYETANKITDEKTRAQALLDVVNEINYFNHQQQTQK